MESKKLPDTPWHVGYAKKKENDPRRHKARCVNIRNSICTKDNSGYYMLRCGGSSHCKYYAETQEQAEDVRKKMMTNEEIAAERAQKYKELKRKKSAELMELGTGELMRRYGRRNNCPVCGGDLIKGRCYYCLFTLHPDEPFPEIPHKKARDNKRKGKH